MLNVPFLRMYLRGWRSQLQKDCRCIICILSFGISPIGLVMVKHCGFQTSSKLNGVVSAGQFIWEQYMYVSVAHAGTTRSDAQQLSVWGSQEFSDEAFKQSIRMRVICSRLRGLDSQMDSEWCKALEQSLQSILGNDENRSSVQDDQFIYKYRQMACQCHSNEQYGPHELYLVAYSVNYGCFLYFVLSTEPRMFISMHSSIQQLESVLTSPFDSFTCLALGRTFNSIPLDCFPWLCGVRNIWAATCFKVVSRPYDQGELGRTTNTVYFPPAIL